MAKIENAKPKNVSGGYVRLFGIPALGTLASKVQSTVISSGRELEKMILERVPRIEDLDTFLQQDIMPDGVYIAPKSQIRKCKSLSFIASEPDFILFKRRHNKQSCHVIELKDGHVFDTKKASAERQNLHAFVSQNASKLPYLIFTHFCCFNQNNREDILTGFKNKIAAEEAMTGKEFCELLELDYHEIVKERE